MHEVAQVSLVQRTVILTESCVGKVKTRRVSYTSGGPRHGPGASLVLRQISVSEMIPKHD